MSPVNQPADGRRGLIKHARDFGDSVCRGRADDRNRGHRQSMGTTAPKTNRNFITALIFLSEGDTARGFMAGADARSHVFAHAKSPAVFVTEPLGDGRHGHARLNALRREKVP